MTRIAYLPGDGIGPEVCAVARCVLEAAGFQAEWVELPIGWREWCERGEALPQATLDALRTCDAGLFGAITSKPDDEAQRELAPRLRGKGLSYRSPILRLRQELDLWANIRPVVTHGGNPNNLSPTVDLVLFRENTEGLYAGVEAHPFPTAVRDAWRAARPSAPLPAAGEDTAVSLRVVTRKATERIVRAAFEYATAEGRQKVTLIEKSNVLRATGGFVRRIFYEVAKGFPSIQTEDVHVDAACAEAVRRPQRFDVVVATNLFGDIFSDVAAEVAGGLPLATACNRGDRFALFEPVHGSAPDIAGKGIANPLGAVLAAAWMARYAGQESVAERVESAVNTLLLERRALPRDLGGSTDPLGVQEALLTGVAEAEQKANV